MLSLIRLEETPQGSIGVLLIDGTVLGWTLEPDSADPEKGHIPGGTPAAPALYPVRRFHGTKWPDTFEIIVEGHTAVLFHAGNREADTRMCVLQGATIGKHLGERAVLNSGETFRTFMKTMGDIQETVLEVIDFYRRQANA